MNSTTVMLIYFNVALAALQQLSQFWPSYRLWEKEYEEFTNSSGLHLIRNNEIQRLSCTSSII